jgi:hypothetical protein
MSVPAPRFTVSPAEPVFYGAACDGSGDGQNVVAGARQEVVEVAVIDAEDGGIGAVAEQDGRRSDASGADDQAVAVACAAGYRAVGRCVIEGVSVVAGLEVDRVARRQRAGYRVGPVAGVDDVDARTEGHGVAAVAGDGHALRAGGAEIDRGIFVAAGDRDGQAVAVGDEGVGADGAVADGDELDVLDQAGVHVHRAAAGDGQRVVRGVGAAVDGIGGM